MMDDNVWKSCDGSADLFAQGASFQYLLYILFDDLQSLGLTNTLLRVSVVFAINVDGWHVGKPKNTPAIEVFLKINSKSMGDRPLRNVVL